MSKLTKKQVTTNVSEDLLKKLKIQAIEEGVNYNVLLEEAIQMLLDSRQQKEKEASPR